MQFVNAFIVGGLLCLLFQIFHMVTKLDVPKVLIIGLFVGGVLTALGICDLLAAWGGAGFVVMVIGAAQAVYDSCLLLFAGNPVPLLTILSIFLSLVVLGLIAGVVRWAIESRKVGDRVEAEV